MQQCARREECGSGVQCLKLKAVDHGCRMHFEMSKKCWGASYWKSDCGIPAWCDPRQVLRTDLNHADGPRRVRGRSPGSQVGWGGRWFESYPQALGFRDGPPLSGSGHGVM